MRSLREDQHTVMFWDESNLTLPRKHWPVQLQSSLFFICQKVLKFDSKGWTLSSGDSQMWQQVMALDCLQPKGLSWTSSRIKTRIYLCALRCSGLVDTYTDTAFIHGTERIKEFDLTGCYLRDERQQPVNAVQDHFRCVVFDLLTSGWRCKFLTMVYIYWSLT